MSPAEIIAEEEARVTAAETLRQARAQTLHKWLTRGQVEYRADSPSHYRVHGSDEWIPGGEPYHDWWPSEGLIARLALGVAALCPFR